MSRATDSRKIVINKCYGGFGLSPAATKRILELGYEIEDNRMCAPDEVWLQYDIPRDHPLLVQAVEEMGRESWGGYAELRVVEIPYDVEWEIDDYDGMEKVIEKRREWF